MSDEIPPIRKFEPTPEQLEQYKAIQRARKRELIIGRTVLFLLWLGIMWGVVYTMAPTGQKYHIWPFG